MLGQNIGIAAQLAARWASMVAKPAVVGLYQVGSKDAFPAANILMTKAMRQKEHRFTLGFKMSMLASSHAPPAG